ncbi:MAG: cobyrinate a,c-diamide synthase [Bacteroidales bacterium]|nr:cobyrinate a,c-diamide synthase [Bacteroidales bacterium]
MSANVKPQILIGAASSGSGKTTFTLGLLRALRNRGIVVQPFKCGPDYIDPQYHSLAAGRDSVNLDEFMCGEGHMREVYATYGADAAVNVVEGVMGLFDGYSRMEGSSAQVAQLLDIPVLLVVNAKSCAYSVAPIIYGYMNFCPGVRIAGVVFNMVGSASHYATLVDACNDLGVPVLGYLPKNNDIAIPSRHLGLSLDEEFLFEEYADKVAAMVEEYVDVDMLLEISTVPMCGVAADNVAGAPQENAHRIAVARDEAFNFIYRENISSLRRLGKVEFFSPLKDTQLPECDLLYLPGGYPELYLEQLQGNVEMRGQIKDYIENGGKCWAECGGMMYLCRSISDEQGREYEMCGVLGQKATMVGKRLQMGYRRFSYAGRELRGHEFHYSRVVPDPGHPLQSIARLYNAAGNEVATPLYRYRNLIAGYTHLYWGNMNLLELF